MVWRLLQSFLDEVETVSGYSCKTSGHPWSLCSVLSKSPQLQRLVVAKPCSCNHSLVHSVPHKTWSKVLLALLLFFFARRK